MLEERYLKIIKGIIYACIISIGILFIGLFISYLLTYGLAQNSIPGYLSSLPSDEANRLTRKWGFNDPWFIQFIKYTINFFTGAWETSYQILPGTPVTELIKIRFPQSLEIMLIPLVYSIPMGIIFGLLAKKLRTDWTKKFRTAWIGRIIQFFTIIGISVPIILLGILLQYNVFITDSEIPAIGSKSPSYAYPPFVTGFLLLDAWLAGDWALANDIYLHMILPLFVLEFAFTAIITKITYSNNQNKTSKKSMLLNTFSTGLLFSLVFSSVILVETIFNRHSLGEIILNSFRSYEFFLISGCFFMIIISVVIFIFISNIFLVFYRFIMDLWKKRKTHPKFNKINQSIPLEGEPQYNKEILSETELRPRTELKKYLIRRLKDPFFIGGLSLTIFLLIIALFASSLTSFSFQDVTEGVFPGQYDLPSTQHPLGTTKFGRDVFALLLYGIQESLIIGTLATLVGIIGGITFGFFIHIFGLVDTRIKLWVKKLVMGILTCLFIIPGIIFVIALVLIIEVLNWIIIIAIGILLIPCFTRIISDTELHRNNIKKSLTKISKKILTKIPLTMGLSIFFFTAVGFLGFIQFPSPNLGDQINEARLHLIDAFWASYWPGVGILSLLFPLFLLHEGLVEYHTTKRISLWVKLKTRIKKSK